ncbi:MAG: DUF3822 family protein [Sphingobacteriales bacterium]|nr:DUF3822 family protein [Sphingobacteriales bacterium]MBI3719345.1 DUF3822 family protein [Sphingobacteriales bacterium]
MIPAIKILPDDFQQFTSSGYQLLILLGRHDWQFALLNREKKLVEGLLAFHFEKIVTEKDFESKWEAVQAGYPLLGKYYSSVKVVLATPEVVLLPGNEFNQSDVANVLNTLHSEREAAVIRTDFIANENLQVAYRLPLSVNRLIERTYINADFKHYYSTELSAAKISSVANGVLVNFFSHKFSAMVIKNNQLQLLNLYDYQQPEDVLFYLLTIAKEFDCNREETVLAISGMIDERSALFAELKKYFVNLQWTEKPANISCTEGFEEYPLHYFHSIFTIAL